MSILDLLRKPEENAGGESCGGLASCPGVSGSSHGSSCSKAG